MNIKRNLHQRIQEMCDCFAGTDPLKEMSGIKNEKDQQEAALKWLALAALHGINDNAKKISITQSADGQIRVTAEYREAELPSPGTEIGDNVFKTLREITHIETGKGKTPLALGIRQDSLDLEVKYKSKKGEEKVTINFPK